MRDWMTGSRKIESFQMKGTHHDYQITVSIPDTTPPQNGFPVLYILDGDAYFILTNEILRLQSRRVEKTKVEEMILVGIGYPDTDVFHSYRVYDFTTPAIEEHLPTRPDGQPWPAHGGADAFLTVIEKQLMPVIREHYPIDATRQALFGHSLGGLFSLYTLFEKADLFAEYIAFSPSIWWNNRAILAKEQNLDKHLAKRLFIAVEHTEQKNMYREAYGLYTRLQEADRLITIDFFASKEDNHMSIVPTAMSRALRFLWK